MSKSTQIQDNRERDSSIPEGHVSLESILCTEELLKRPFRAPDYQKENGALVTLSNALADSPRTIFQTLAETILEVCQSGSSGISLLTKEDGGKRFYWPAIAGKWKPHIGGGTPRDFGPLRGLYSIAIALRSSSASNLRCGSCETAQIVPTALPLT